MGHEFLVGCAFRAHSDHHDLVLEIDGDQATCLRIARRSKQFFYKHKVKLSELTKVPPVGRIRPGTTVSDHNVLSNIKWDEL